MPGKTALKLTKRTIEALFAEGRDTVFWDSELAGFGVRVYRTGRRVYCVQTRGPAGPKRVTLGRHGEITSDAARRQAAAVIDRIKRGEAPFPVAPEPELTVAGLAERFLRSHVEVNCSANTKDSFRRIVRNHILPALGGLAVAAVERRHVVALHDSLSAMPTQANRTLAVLSAMFRLAEAWDLAPPGRNPCRGVRRYKEKPRERFLSRDEYRRLGRVLAEAEKDGSENPVAVAAIRLLLLTGCRKNEILSLQWDDVDRVTGELRLKDTKSGARRVPLTPAVEAVLSGIPRSDDSSWVIPGRRPDRRLGGDPPGLDASAGARRPGGCAAPRPAPQLCLARAGARRRPADDRPAARPCHGECDGALCPSVPRTARRRPPHGSAAASARPSWRRTRTRPETPEDLQWRFLRSAPSRSARSTR